MIQASTYVDGRWAGASDGAERPVLDPSTGRQFATVPESTAADAEQAVAAAHRAFVEGEWPRWSAEERRQALYRLADAIDHRIPELAELMRRDTGSPVRAAAPRQVARATPLVRLGADKAPLGQPRAVPAPDGAPPGTTTVEHLPTGVWAAFVPYNFPLVVTANKLVALAMGNTLVVKASPLAPFGAIEVARAAKAAGIPPGVLNVVVGDAAAGSALAVHPLVRGITFTGSTAVGAQVLAAAAPTFKRSILELGGKGAALVLDDADLDLTVGAVLAGMFAHSGQLCGAMTRLVVPEAMLAEVGERIAATLASVVVGPTDDPATDLGPLISAAQVEKVDRVVASTVDAGATAVVGGRRVADLDGFFYEPTVLLDVPTEAGAWREEIFGPVLCVVPYRDEQHAVDLVNDSPYGLTNTVWSTDPERAAAVARGLRSGVVAVNAIASGNPEAPFGGFGMSGLGREMGEVGALAYTEPRQLWTAADPAGFAPLYALTSGAFVPRQPDPISPQP